VASTVFVGRTLSDRSREPIFVVDDDACSALRDSQGHHLVTAIAPVGTDAAFNRVQVPRLLTDIGEVASSSNDGNTREQLVQLARFISEHFPIEVDAYVVFMAD
jgi:hypothetical protein